MMCCTKYNTCLNYKIRCADCKANSDIYNHYPLYKDRDLVEVVRCKDCRYSEPYLHYFYCQNDNAPWAENTMANIMDANDFCSYGERQCENG